ncbi:hypothetical protein RB195_009782 [Necator americanus]|uniref:Uncharacterized protein n=1 Tax=Necator americanus TaxID=51031 RepID=A0ABR1CVP3_NECAM
MTTGERTRSTERSSEVKADHRQNRIKESAVIRLEDPKSSNTRPVVPIGIASLSLNSTSSAFLCVTLFMCLRYLLFHTNNQSS